MNEYYEFRSKRIKELDETFEITHFYGDDYPENINIEVNKIINNEWKLNNLQSKIDKANEILDKLEMQPAYLDCKYYELGGFDELRNVLKENKYDKTCIH